MTILLDDTWHCIDSIEGERFYGPNEYHYDFDYIVEKILTKSQWNRFIQYDTHRTFKLSKKKEQILRQLINKINNP